MKSLNKTELTLDDHLKPYVEEVKKQRAKSSEENDALKRVIDNVCARAEIERESNEKSLFSRLALLAIFPKWQWVSSMSAALVMVLFITITGTGSKSSFASVVKKLNEITSLYYEGNIMSDGKPIMTLKVFFLAPDKVRVETQPLTKNSENGLSINVLDVSKGKGVIRFPHQNVAVPFSFDAENKKSNAQDNPLYWLELVSSHQGDVEILPEKVVNGVSSNGFVIVDSVYNITIWANKENNLPVKVITEIKNGQMNDHEKVIMKMEADLTFNRVLDPDLFSLENDEAVNQ